MGMSELEMKQVSDNHFNFLCRKLEDIFSVSLNPVLIISTARDIQAAIYESFRKHGKVDLERVEFDLLFLRDSLQSIDYIRECFEKDINGTV